MNKEMKCKAKCDTLLVKEKNENGNEHERTVTDQKESGKCGSSTGTCAENRRWGWTNKRL